MSEPLPFGLTTDFFYLIHSQDFAIQAALEAFRSTGMTADDAHNILTVIFNKDTRERVSIGDISTHFDNMLEDEEARLGGGDEAIAHVDMIQEAIATGGGTAYEQGTANDFLAQNVFPLDLFQMFSDMGVTLTPSQAIIIMSGDIDRFCHYDGNQRRYLGSLVHGYMHALKESGGDKPTRARIDYHTNSRGSHDLRGGEGDLVPSVEPAPPAPDPYPTVLPQDDLPEPSSTPAPPDLANAQPGRRRVPNPPRGRGRERRARE